MCTLLHAGTDPVNLSDALKQLKHNYCHNFLCLCLPGRTSRASSLSSRREPLPMGSSSTDWLDDMPGESPVGVCVCACVYECVPVVCTDLLQQQSDNDNILLSQYLRFLL